VAGNRLGRNFTAAAPNQVWASEITGLGTDGWLQRAIVRRPSNRRVVGWSLKPRRTVKLATD